MRVKRITIICVLLALLLTVSGVGVCFAEEGDNSENTPIPYERIAGADRYETSRLVANATARGWLPLYEGVIITTGRDYADALGGAGLQGNGYAPAPVLLVNDDPQVMKAVAENIKEHYINNPYEMTREIWIIGGKGAVSEEMENILANSGLPSYLLYRLSGSNRYETNLAVLGRSPFNKPLVICSSKNYADALSASASRCPVMLVGDSLTQKQMEYVAKRQKYGVDKTCVIAGGNGAVSEKVEEQLKELGMETTRLAGKDRYETSYLVAEYFTTSIPSGVVLAFGGDFPDGLSGAGLASDLSGPLLLVDNNHYMYAEQYVKDHSPMCIKVLGGVSLISNATAERIASMSDL